MCVAHVKISPLFSFFFTPSFRSPVYFVHGLALSLYFSLLHPVLLTSILVSYVFGVGVLRLFWLVSMLHPTLADWLKFSFFKMFFSYFFLNFVHSFLFFSLLLTLGHVMRPYLAACNFCVIWLLILSNKCFLPHSFSPSLLNFIFKTIFFLGT